LLELINNSSYFKSKSNGEKYKLPDSESNGENDANTRLYGLDFKLIVSQENMHETFKNKPDVDYTHIKNGYITVMEKEKVKSNDENILIKLSRFRLISQDKKIKDDINSVIKNMKKNKNLFWYYPYEISLSDNNGIEIVRKILFLSSEDILKYRDSLLNNKDTFICVKINEEFIIFEWYGQDLKCVDKVHELFCPTYRDIKLLSVY